MLGHHADIDLYQFCVSLQIKLLLAVPSATPSTPTRRRPRTAPTTWMQKPKQKKRYRPGTVALREIRHFQKTWNLVIPAAPFIRLFGSMLGILLVAALQTLTRNMPM
ncbi:hypothetical protein K7X08_036105 [Anisodus acutangulus]|uniref:Histone H2A/H2B/H3 domain-containing protein n=1 Tax=Anisodus acutangulus TaxID=402998 RepID=A0A9Q1QUK0_9SOLA|nr:hypothetical protein K7X08_036105 [Anisodus acutangulus]